MVMLYFFCLLWNNKTCILFSVSVMSSKPPSAPSACQYYEKGKVPDHVLDPLIHQHYEQMGSNTYCLRQSNHNPSHQFYVCGSMEQLRENYRPQYSALCTEKMKYFPGLNFCDFSPEMTMDKCKDLETSK